MQLRDLSEQEKRIATAAVAAIANGPFIDDEEFHTVLGFDRQEFQHVYGDMLNGRDDEETSRAIGQSLNNLIGYPHGMLSLMEKMVGCTTQEIATLAERWFNKDATNYFDPLQ